MKATIIFMMMMVLAGQTTLAQECDCAKNFEWIRKTFEQNDAGFTGAVQRKGAGKYMEHNQTYLQKAKKLRDKFKCAELLNEWLHFFRKAHLYAAAIGERTTASADAWPELVVNEKQIFEQASLQQTPGLEGIWTTGNYSIAIVKAAAAYKGVVLQATGNNWKSSQVKLEIAADLSGVYYMGDRSALKFSKAMLVGNNTLQLGSIFLSRSSPVSADDDATALYVKTVKATAPFMQQLSDSSLLFCIPSFEESQKYWIDSLLLANKTLIEKTPNLIIDIRNNGGGSDISYEKIIPLLYTHPIRTIGMEMLSTEMNNKRMENYLEIPGLSPQDKKEINEALELLRANTGKFVNLNADTVSILAVNTAAIYPKNIAIIINEKNGSTAEQFLLAAKQSQKVKLFGTTTMGVLDISNMYAAESPSGDIRLGYCLSRSLRIPAMPIDDIGIQPDHFIDATIPAQHWLAHVKQLIEN